LFEHKRQLLQVRPILDIAKNAL